MNPPSAGIPGRVLSVAVIGCGAIGSYLAGKLAASGAVVSVVARGPHRDAMAQRGLRLEGTDGSVDRVHVHVVPSIDAVASHDIAVIGFKSYQLPPLARELAALARRCALTVTIQNGVPWWFLQGMGGTYDGRVIRSVDPAGELAAAFAGASLAPGFAFKSAELTEPGVLRHRVAANDRFAFGVLEAEHRPALERWVAALVAAGVPGQVDPAPRQTAWLKLMGNLPVNPLSALTRACVGDIATFPATRDLMVAMIGEGMRVAGRLGVRLEVDPHERIERSANLGSAKASMLQDLERGRPMEIEAIVGAVVELAEMTGADIPVVRAVHACLQLLGRTSAGPSGAANPAGAPQDRSGRA